MREEKKERSVSLCPVCQGIASISWKVSANGLSKPLCITGKGGDYAIVWTCGYEESDTYQICRCVEKPNEIEGVIFTWLGEVRMKAWNAYATFFALEEGWFEQQKVRDRDC